ncbi:integral membrane protein GPR137-like [Myxocyprinus asiaticus]|uniref:integral membrane protein GPR137-like n=1 Tax=Myxocyprinus asiaticus TaxID=70543 RepID=UPI0022231394|nr:integral membrane protein GPR137-like [Myxocyprinus asiaticus]XP_051514265.1 integral membrane protein GPR137-like [Myxocyprinus asiaticus]XP_051514266.1 integral membrane protein GPR137-like [Myxocyprinus asiaticus]XP_051514267.1 integral membrane protein GPR137-like [Myxocyprinus asiaticus]
MQAPVPPSPIRPAVAPSVELGVTVLYTCLYGSLFLVVFIQLWLLFLCRHKRWSYQSIFLFLCLFWAALRTTLFSFYFRDALAANHLPTPVYWLLYCFPVCLQFFTLSLFNLYFTQELLKVRSLFNIEPSKGLWLARCVYAAMSAAFLCVNVVCASFGKHGGSGGAGDKVWNVVLVRVLVNDLLFILEAVCLATSLLLLTRFSSPTTPYLRNKGLCPTAVLGAGVILLFSTRACYNLAVLFLSQNHKVEAFDYDWYNISDQADLRSELGERGYIIFGAVLFIWELLPTSLLILIFRVRQSPQERNCSPAMCNTQSSRSYFFDDPRGMDDDSGSLWSQGINPHSSWFGSSETTPLLFNKTGQNSQHHSLYSTPQT